MSAPIAPPSSTASTIPATPGTGAVVHHADGLLLVEDGHVAACGPWAELAPSSPPTCRSNICRTASLTPGFVDTHIHFPQIDMIAAFSGQLLDWFEEKTFPAERACRPGPRGRRGAGVSRRAAAQRHDHGDGLRLGAPGVGRGPVRGGPRAQHAADRRQVVDGPSGPEGLSDTVERGRAETEALIRDWGRRGRLGYAVTPRFALSSTPEQRPPPARSCTPMTMSGCRPIWPRIQAKFAVADAFPQSRDYSTPTTGLVWSRTVRCSPTPSTRPTGRCTGWRRPARRSPTARRRTCSSAAAFSLTPPAPTPTASASVWARMSEPGPASMLTTAATAATWRS